MRNKGRIYVRGIVTRIRAGACVQCISPFIVVDDVKFSSANDKVCECNCVGYFIFPLPDNKGVFAQAPVDEAGDDPDGILIAESPEFITVSTAEKLNADHVIYGLVGTFYFNIYWKGISSSGFNNNFIVNADFHEVCVSDKLFTFINPEEGDFLTMVTGEPK